jgi:hypothetical protein
MKFYSVFYFYFIPLYTLLIHSGVDKYNFGYMTLAVIYCLIALNFGYMFTKIVYMCKEKRAIKKAKEAREKA